MIDVHFHCLPGIDDGPKDWESAVALCHAAAADGINTIVATPHVLRSPWINSIASERDALLTELNDKLGGHPKVLPGCEYFFSSDAIELWELGVAGPLTGLNRSGYLLLEFPARQIPKDAEAVIYELALKGVTPVIAHPERNLVFADRPERLRRFLDLGAISQVTAASVTGDFGRAAMTAADEFVRRGLVNVVASDSHSLEQRPPTMSAARAAIRQRWGAAAETELFEVSPAAIIGAAR